MSAQNAFSQFTPESVDDRDALQLINTARAGISFSAFEKFSKNIPFTLADWANCLPVSQRTLQRYRDNKENVLLDKSISEKILEISFLFTRGALVFGDANRFYNWLTTKNLTVGGVAPKDLLDTTFGIHLLKDELTRIEHGVLA